MQGLNFIAGLMLLVVHDEEKVFWLMDTLLNKILPGINPLTHILYQYCVITWKWHKIAWMLWSSLKSATPPAHGGVSYQPPTDNTWSTRSPLCPPEQTCLTELVEAADDSLFQRILAIDNHILSSLLPQN